MTGEVLPCFEKLWVCPCLQFSLTSQEAFLGKAGHYGLDEEILQTPSDKGTVAVHSGPG